MFGSKRGARRCLVSTVPTVSSTVDSAPPRPVECLTIADCVTLCTSSSVLACQDLPMSPEPEKARTWEGLTSFLLAFASIVKNDKSNVEDAWERMTSWLKEVRNSTHRNSSPTSLRHLPPKPSVSHQLYHTPCPVGFFRDCLRGVFRLVLFRLVLFKAPPNPAACRTFHPFPPSRSWSSTSISTGPSRLQHC